MLEPVLHTKFVRVTALATGMTILWVHDDALSWGRYIDHTPIDHTSFPLMVQLRVAPGHRSWPQRITVRAAGVIQQVLNPDCLSMAVNLILSSHRR